MRNGKGLGKSSKTNPKGNALPRCGLRPPGAATLAPRVQLSYGRETSAGTGGSSFFPSEKEASFPGEKEGVAFSLFISKNFLNLRQSK